MGTAVPSDLKTHRHDMHARKTITSLGQELDLSAESFGWLTPSSDLLDDRQALRQRLDTEGYLYMPGYLDCDVVDRARLRLLEQLDELELLDPGHPVEQGVAKQPWEPTACHDLIHENVPLQRLLYDGRMIELYERLLQGPVRTFDFTWMRVMGPGPGVAPHADSVYMNRGTRRLFTSWTPLMEISLELGGLMVMPGSHRSESLQEYFEADVDTYCTNREAPAPQGEHEWIGPLGDGKLTQDPAKLQKVMGRRWLTAERYQPGDVLLFSIYTVHASIDNSTTRVRLSTDSRYQRADEPADERWVGPKPTGHGKNARKGLIC
jgi:hypothetical protein